MDTFEHATTGKILRLKTGYNPNSSSVGSQIPALFAFYAGSGALVVMALHSFRWVAKLMRKQGAITELRSNEDAS